MKLKHALCLIFAVAAVVRCVGDSTEGNDGGPDATANDSGSDVVVQDSGNDAVAQDSGPGDAGAEAEAGPACDPTKAFGTPAPVTGLDTPASEGDARLTHDELTVYFTRGPSADAGVDGGTGLTDLFFATRSTTTDPFGAATPITALNTTSYEASPSPTGDDLTLYYTTDKGGLATGYWDVIAATRNTTADAWGNPSSLLGVSDAGSEQLDVYVLASNLVLYFTSNSSTNNYPFHLYRASRATTGDTFAVDTSGLLNTINTGNRDRFPVVTPDELTLYFGTDRSGGSDYDIYVSKRASKAVAFGAKTDVTELSTTTDSEVPNWISDDGCRIYFTRSGDIYMATKPL
jgi:hypothetical protein